MEQVNFKNQKEEHQISEKKRSYKKRLGASLHRRRFYMLFFTHSACTKMRLELPTLFSWQEVCGFLSYVYADLEFP